MQYSSVILTVLKVNKQATLVKNAIRKKSRDTDLLDFSQSRSIILLLQPISELSAPLQLPPPLGLRIPSEHENISLRQNKNLF